MRTATETVVKLLGRADIKRWRFFIVKRAACPELAAGTLQGHTAIDQFRDIRSRNQFVDKLFGYSGHSGGGDLKQLGLSDQFYSIIISSLFTTKRVIDA